jgi:hypothetical protein
MYDWMKILELAKLNLKIHEMKKSIYLFILFSLPQNGQSIGVIHY